MAHAGGEVADGITQRSWPLNRNAGGEAVVGTFGPPHAIAAHSLGCAITALAITNGLPARSGSGS